MNEMLPTLLDLLQMFAEHVQVRSTCYIKSICDIVDCSADVQSYLRQISYAYWFVFCKWYNKNVS